MKLPNAEKAVVERTKITDYLLNAAHPDNGGKAEFFGGLGSAARIGKSSLRLSKNWRARPKSLKV